MSREGGSGGLRRMTREGGGLVSEEVQGARRSREAEGGGPGREGAREKGQGGRVVWRAREEGQGSRE